MQSSKSIHLTFPESAIAAATAGVAILTCAGSLFAHGLWQPLNVTITAALLPCLVLMVVLAYQFPIYIRHNAKICIFTVPLFLLTALLTPAVAGLSAAIAIGTGEFVVRKRHGNRMEQIVTHAGRWAVLATAASLVAHVSIGGPSGRVFLCTAAAALLWVGDLVTLPLVLGPLTGESPLRLIRTVVREGGLVEAVQYTIGLIGVMAALQQVWAVGLLALPTAFVYLTYRKEVDPDTLELLESMADAVDLRDSWTGGHSQRVAELVRGTLRELGRNGQEATLILVAARLHDIGKLGVPDSVLLKSGPLTPEEQQIVETVPVRGVDLLRRYPDFARGVDMVRYLHERWDGQGYPNRLSGTDIPFGARVIAVADAYDAMTSERPYRRALSPDQAASILMDGSGRQWDPGVVDAFLKSIDSTLTGSRPPVTCQVHAPAAIAVRGPASA